MKYMPYSFQNFEFSFYFAKLKNITVHGNFEIIHGIIWTMLQENQILLNANNKNADQPAHPCSLTSTFVIHSWLSKIFILASYKIFSTF